MAYFRFTFSTFCMFVHKLFLYYLQICNHGEVLIENKTIKRAVLAFVLQPTDLTVIKIRNAFIITTKGNSTVCTAFGF